MKEMDKRLIAPLILCAVSPLGYAAQNCEATAGIAAGAADYLYETAQVKTTSRLHFNSAPDVECQLPAFLVNGNTVEVLRVRDRPNQQTLPFILFAMFDTVMPKACSPQAGSRLKVWYL
jgi:hypothetical protein